MFFKGGYVMRLCVCEFAGTEENVNKDVEVTKSKSKSKSERQELDALKAGDKSWTL